MPTGSIGCAAMNITDEQIGALVKLAIPLAAVVELIKAGTPTAAHFAAAKESVLQIMQMMRTTYPFSLFDFPADGHDIQQIFSDEYIENAIAYINAAQEIGVGAAFDEQYKKGVGVIKLISELAQLGSTLMIYTHGMIDFAHKLHDSKRTPEGYADTFAEHFNAAPTLSLDNPMWMQLTNTTMQYVSAAMPEKEIPQLTLHKKRVLKSVQALKEKIASLSSAEQETVTKARVGQGYFRDLLINKYSCKCALCSISTKSMLTASHIKEWAASTDAEKLDENNGLLLCAHHDALFDKHLITFDNAGNVQISPTLTAQEQLDLGLTTLPSITVTPAMLPYLAVHQSKLRR